MAITTLAIKQRMSVSGPGEMYLMQALMPTKDVLHNITVVKA